jgi:hypothetical protein
MAWSWVRVATATSPKLEDCTGDDKSARKFEECVRTIVANANGRVDDVKFEPNGRWARVHFYWEDVRVKHAVIYDLQADEVLDGFSSEEMDNIRTRDG